MITVFPAELRVISGYERGMFGLGNPVTYEQMVKMFIVYLEDI